MNKKLQPEQRNLPKGHLFTLGRLLQTPGALDLSLEHAFNYHPYILRHLAGDWGNVPEEDAQADNEALNRDPDKRDRIISSYQAIEGNPATRFWIITECDR